MSKINFRNFHPIQATQSVVKAVYQRFTRFLLAHPAPAFFGFILLLLGLILAGHFIAQSKIKVVPEVPTVKAVTTFMVGSTPKVQMIGKVEKSGVVTVVAQSGGIVHNIYVKAGQKIKKGQRLVRLSTNYQGGSIPTVMRQIAQKNTEFTKTNYDAQKDLIAKRREIANQTQIQADALRAIAADSQNDSQNLINLNQEILTGLDAQIADLENCGCGGAYDDLILQIKQSKAMTLSGLNSVKSALANTKYQVNSDNSPKKLVDIQHDLTLAQLALEEKTLDLNKDISVLNLRVAQISESLLYPVSPVTGVVERVNVQLNQNVSAGAALVMITADKTATTVIVLVPSETAHNLSRLDPSIIHVGDQKIEALPTYVSLQPTDGNLHAVTFVIPETEAVILENDASVTVDLPIGTAKTAKPVDGKAAQLFVPLDAVFQSQTDSYLFVVTKNDQDKTIATSKKIQLGTVFGQYVEVVSGLNSGDQIILNRQVLDGDLIQVAQ